MSRDQSKLVYASTHEWADIQEVEGVRYATIGVSAFAIEQLNDLVYMDLPEVGREVNAGDELGEVESVKAVSPLYSPVTGEVVEVHSELPDELEQLNSDPYDFGWIAKIRLTSDSGIENLLSFDDYQRQCSESA
ncbi:MAG: glycine cleavage system protein GcvH [Rubripirellula sp.]|jgi:glycine cleavage system H protein|nr:glycine cleavage system protein GcvH [Rubripirellula sp.]